MNWFYLLKFILFNIIIFIYYIFYFIFYSFYFIFKNYRFFGYYYQRFKVSKSYYQYKSIYFSFWRYLTIFLIKYFYSIILLIINFFKFFLINILYINNIYTFIYIFIKKKYIFNFVIINKIFKNIFKIILVLRYHFFYFYNLDLIYKFFKKIKIFKYLEDPIAYRNTFINVSSNFFFFYKYLSEIKIFIFIKSLIKIPYKSLLKKYILWYLIFVIHKLRLYFDANKNRLLKNIFFNVWSISYIKIKNRFLILIKFIIYYFNIILINIIFLILMCIVNLLYGVIKILVEFKYYFLWLIVFLVFIKYYWIIYYFFMILYKHYSLFLPLNEVKETSRFFNFEWIDLRNYYNLIMLHNTLVDISLYNNVLYNDLIHNLDKNLSTYGYKITQQYNAALYSCWFLNNKDTTMLHKLLNIYNKIKTHKQLKKFNKFRKIFALKVKDLYKSNKIKRRIKYKKELDLYYNNLVNSSNISDSSYFYLKKGLPLKNTTKMKIAIWNYYNRFYIKRRITKKYITFNINHYLRVKKIPLKYIWLYKNDSYFNSIMKIKTYNSKLFNYFNVFKLWKKNLSIIYVKLKQSKIKHNNFYFGWVYDYNNCKNKFLYKYNIPTYNWTPNTWAKRVSNNTLLDTLYINTLEENQSFKAVLDTSFHRGRYSHHYNYLYIKIKYPYRVYNKNYVEQIKYIKLLNSNIKLVKKYNYFINNKIYFNKRYYKIILESKNLLLRLIISKLKLHDAPFLKNYLNNFFIKYYSRDMIDFYYVEWAHVDLGIHEELRTEKIRNFWYFFDYIKVNKFYTSKYKNIYKDSKNISLFFIKKTRKDYIKFRATIIRLLTLYHYYYNFEMIYTKSLGQVGDRNYLIRKRYDNLKLNWYMNTYLTNDRQNVKLFKNLKVLIYFFKMKYMPYYLYYDYNINAYNGYYNIKIKTYKFKVLNKISNLKRFFFNHNKNKNGWSIFKYLNSFSLNFHIKHLLWHSPYSFLYYNYNKIDDQNFILGFNKTFEYIYDEPTVIHEIGCNSEEFDETTVILNNYSIIFNLYLNINIIKNVWVDIVIDTNYLLSLESIFNWYYNFGCIKNYNNLNSKIEIYRVLINLLYQYYNNFLYRIIRYRYILDNKEYTIIKFIKRYFNFKDWFWHTYIRLRIQIYKYLYYGKMFLKRNYMKTFKLKNLYSHRIRQVKLISFWFYFDKYIKIFIFYLIKNYYTKSFIVLYWLNEVYNWKLRLLFFYYYNLMYLCVNKIFYLKRKVEYTKIVNNYSNYLFGIKLYYKIKLLNIQYTIIKIFSINKNFNIKYKLLNYIYNLMKQIKYNLYYLKFLLLLKISKILLLNEYKWYFKLIFEYNFKLLDGTNIKMLCVFFKYYFLYFNIKILYKVNNLIFIKIYLEKLIIYYLKILFNIKQSIVYFKSNYYYFRKQRSLNRFKYHKKRKLLIFISFLQTNIVRKISSLKHFSYNIFLFKNFYLLNLYNFIYLTNKFNFNNINIFDLFLFVLKYNFLYTVLLFYLFSYWIILLLLFIFYKKFYIIFFCCNFKEQDLQKIWETSIFDKSNSIKCVKIFNSKTETLKTIIKKNKYWSYYYNFILFKKINILNNYLVKIFALNKINKKFIYFDNNNKLLNINETNTKVIESNSFIFKIFNFIKNIQINKLTVKKEMKLYNFYFYNLLNNNLLNYCFLYWLILVPYFFFEYILIKYHLKGHIRKKRQLMILVKVFLENFKLYIQLYKFIGKGLYNRWKCKIPKNYYSALTFRKKKKLKHGFYFKWDRYQKVIRRSSPMGSYFYWFLHINKFEYIICYFKYYFISSFISNYFFFVYVYIILLFLIIKYYSNFLYTIIKRIKLKKY
jgi:hypothetical protein